MPRRAMVIGPGTLATEAASPEAYYRQVSPQLLARVRQLWSARGLDLDLAWRTAIREMPGCLPLETALRPRASRPVDMLLLFDQAAIWAHCLRVGTACAWRTVEAGRRSALSGDQLRGLLAVLGRLADEIAAVRVLAAAGLAMPAMQIMRSLSEDVDMALVLLVRPKVARQFAECRTPQAAGEFWKRHIAGGRAFRAVAEQLYRVGLDHSEQSSYARWRKEVQVLLGAAVHTSYAGGHSADDAGTDGLYFATLRLQELCVYSLMLGQALRVDIGAGAVTASTAEQALIRVALEGGEIVLDQMRWLTAAQEPDATGPPVS